MSSTTNSANICVVGGGIMGMSSAYCLAREYQGCTITIFSEDFTPNTTSDYAFGMVFGARIRDIRNYGDKKLEWVKATKEYCQDVCCDSKLAKEMGLKPIDGFYVITKKVLGEVEADPNRESVVTSVQMQQCLTYFRHATDEEVQDKFLSNNVDFATMLDSSETDCNLESLLICAFGAFVFDTAVYLAWLKKSLIEMQRSKRIRSVRFVSRSLNHITELMHENFDLIINCSGLGAGKLVDDADVHPIRAQWTVVHKPSVNNVYYGARTCICPTKGGLVLGSVYQTGRTVKEIDPVDTEDLWRRAKALFPELNKKRILGEYVRFRPGRYGGPRVGIEILQRGRQKMNIIHNYGHAGSGIGQHWGSALEVLKFAKQILPTTPSKL